MWRLAAAAGLAGICATGATGCGDSDKPLPPVEPTQPEKTDRPARLPEGWKRLVNRRAGFSVGIPPGWKGRGARGATLVRSGDKLMAVSITADRSPDGRVLKPTAYAEHLIQALPGYTTLKVGRPVPQRGAHYPGGSVIATGAFRRTRVRQAIRVVALQRRGQVTYALVFFRTAKSPAALYRPAVTGMIRTFRARAPLAP
jgi:hypothetical protein